MSDGDERMKKQGGGGRRKARVLSKTHLSEDVIVAYGCGGLPVEHIAHELGGEGYLHRPHPIASLGIFFKAHFLRVDFWGFVSGFFLWGFFLGFLFGVSFWVSFWGFFLGFLFGFLFWVYFWVSFWGFFLGFLFGFLFWVSFWVSF